jgi:hypothetical protein
MGFTHQATRKIIAAHSSGSYAFGRGVVHVGSPK